MARINEYQLYDMKNFLFDADENIAVCVCWNGKRYEIIKAWTVSDKCTFEDFPFNKTDNRKAEMETTFTGEYDFGVERNY